MAFSRLPFTRRRNAREEGDSVNERLHESFELAGFVDRGINGAFLLKSGSIGQVIEIRGRDTECLDDDQILEVGNRFETAVRSLDHRFRLYQYQIKNTESDGLFCVRNFMILMLEPPKFKAGISKVLSRQFAIESVMTQQRGNSGSPLSGSWITSGMSYRHGRWTRRKRSSSFPD